MRELIEAVQRQVWGTPWNPHVVSAPPPLDVFALAGGTQGYTSPAIAVVQLLRCHASPALLIYLSCIVFAVHHTTSDIYLPEIPIHHRALTGR